MIDIKQQVKEYLLKESTTLTNIVNIMNTNRPDDESTTVQNINNKLTRGTIKYSEILEIAEIMGYNIVWQKPNSSGLFTQMGTTIGGVTDLVTSPLRLFNPLTWGNYSQVTSNIKELIANDNKDLIEESKKYEWYDKMPDETKNELFNETQERFEIEVEIDKLVFEFISKISRLFLSSTDASDSIKQIFQNYNKYDYFETSSKVRLFYRILHPFIHKNYSDIALLATLVRINFIYENGGLEKLSNEELEELKPIIKYYLSNNWKTKQKVK